MKRLVIYTCVTGGYDRLTTPSALSTDADYVFFSDSELTDKVWDVRPILHHEKDGHMTNRWYKMHAAELFPGYEYSLWIDGNISITGDDFYNRVTEQMDEGTLFAGIMHPERDDVYDESLRILANHRDTFFSLAKTAAFLRREKFPRHWGLFEANVMLRRHSDNRVAEMDGMWWRLINDYSGRDQMTQTYCLWKTGIRPAYLLPPGVSARNCPELSYARHGDVYVKDLSLKGRYRDARTALSKTLYCIYLRILGIKLTLSAKKPQEPLSPR